MAVNWRQTSFSSIESNLCGVHPVEWVWPPFGFFHLSINWSVRIILLLHCSQEHSQESSFAGLFNINDRYDTDMASFCEWAVGHRRTIGRGTLFESLLWDSQLHRYKNLVLNSQILRSRAFLLLMTTMSCLSFFSLLFNQQ